MSDGDALTDAVSALLRDLLSALEAFDWAGRRLHPAALPQLVDALQPLRSPLVESIGRIAELNWPEDVAGDGARLERAGTTVLEALDGFRGGGGSAGTLFGEGAGIGPYYRALRKRVGAFEELYPLCNVLVPVSRYFLEEPVRGSQELLAKLATLSGEESEPVGLIDVANDRRSRGGFTLYVPEYYETARSWPLVVALHGGSGHGADFVWSWLREARSRGFLVLSPTAQGDTWSMLSPAVDGDALTTMVARVGEHWNVDSARVLLTGMSDGATFSLIAGFGEGAPYTHLAPMCGVLPPMSGEAKQRARDLPVYLVHGALDWMFPIEVARMARDELERLGASVVYREIADLSHTYPREQNALVADWLGVPLAGGA